MHHHKPSKKKKQRLAQREREDELGEREVEMGLRKLRETVGGFERNSG
jgi:hypothetical protein